MSVEFLELILKCIMDATFCSNFENKKEKEKMKRKANLKIFL